MAFTVQDFDDLLHLLDERPEWREALRRRVLADELLELPARAISSPDPAATGG
jgi:hypothetical protein